MKLRSQAGRSSGPLVDAPVSPEATGRLGVTLAKSGDLSPEDMERIADHQARTGMAFADAAIDLGLIAPEAVTRAISEQTHAGAIDLGASGISPAVVAAFDPLDPLTVKLRALRSTLFPPEEMRNPAIRIIVLTGVDSDGSAGIAANLAVLVAQLGFSGILVDANFAAPTQHNLFGLANDEGVTSLLAGVAGQEPRVVRTPVPDLDLLATGPEIATLSEAVERVSIAASLRAMRQGHRFAIIDAGHPSPEILAAIARGTDGVLIVAERKNTPLEAMQTVIGRLRTSDINVLGTILAR